MEFTARVEGEGVVKVIFAQFCVCAVVKTRPAVGCGHSGVGGWGCWVVVHHYFRAHNEYNKLTKSLILPLRAADRVVSPKSLPAANTFVKDS